MYSLALKILFGDRGKYLGIITGIALASLIMIQQPGILVSILSHTYSFISDISLPDIWVMDPKVKFIDDSRPMLDTQLYRVRGVQGVEWAVPLYKGSQRVRLADGELVGSNMLGFDDATLIGGPTTMLEGKLADLHLPDAVIVDEAGAKGRLASTTPDGKRIPLRIGDVVEINDKRAMVVGIARGTPTFQSQPILYTTYTRAENYSLSERKLLSYVLVKAKTGESAQAVARRITRETGLAAFTAEEFKRMSLDYFLNNTSILINFGFVVVVGFVVGAAVTGQIFYNFTLDNLRHFGVFKAMGATDRMLLQMIMLQALLVGFIGFGIGAGICGVFAAVTRHSTDLTLQLNWQLLAGSGTAVFLIVMFAGLISVRKVLKLEAAEVFKG
ncbi:MAG: ABC transporter permease [Syntrophobacterales bacterium]|jgi:putative ABC transport system permease protein|nr:ABC transporter permease [Syntrophobacterales bacterium]